MKRQTPERCSFRFRRVRAAYVCTCSLSLSFTLRHAQTHIVYTTPMMKTKRAFLRNSIRGARTLVFSPPDSSGLPGREQLQAFLCFLGCLRRIVYVYVCAYASRLYFAAHQFLILFFSHRSGMRSVRCRGSSKGCGVLVITSFNASSRRTDVIEITRRSTSLSCILLPQKRSK